MTKIYKEAFIGTAGQKPEELKAAELFESELERRKAEVNRPSEIPAADVLKFVFEKRDMDKDSFAVESKADTLVFAGGYLRSLIYAYSLFLRKSEYKGGQIELCEDISGTYAPDKPIRGHQLGYRPKNNTYDAWSREDFRRYYLDMMAFGSNIVELMPGGTDDANRNELMRLSADDMLVECCDAADEVDIDVSLWYPNCDEELNPVEAADARRKVFERLKRVNYVFPPGGDPGDFPADVFLARSIETAKVLKQVFPNAEMWPSAQKPKRMPNWGPEFIKGLEELPPEIDGVITGPNRAFRLDELRRRLPMKYPIRLYPDVTHNVRCEFPVHTPRDDWHFAFASTLGRESINPRPTEYRLLHELESRYSVGSVSYSEGCNDDINKMVYGMLDFDPSADIRTILEDYSRAFFIGADPEKAADGILALEKNWFGDPAENPLIESTLGIWESLLADTPSLIDNWRFVSCLFRARADAVVRRRRVRELEMLKNMEASLKKGDVTEAYDALFAPVPESYTDIRHSLNDLARILFKTIGLQLNIKEFHAAAPDRGAVLETIDNNITDVAYYRRRLGAIIAIKGEAEREAAAAALYAHHHPKADEFVFSVATDTMERFGGKPIDTYLNFRGDSAGHNNGSVPLSLLGLYDDYEFRCQLGGFTPGQSYKLRIIWQRHNLAGIESELYIVANGRDIYRGPYDGGETDEAYDNEWVGDKYCSRVYDIPADVFVNGCVELLFGEKRLGVEFAQFSLTRA